MKVFKQDVKASEFIESISFETLEMPSKMIMHTRAATQGDVKINSNNHPIVNETSSKALIHNGVISNEADFDVPLTVVDSLAVMKAYEKYPEADKQELFTNLKGGYAIALLDEERPDELVLFRHTNPMQLMFDTKTDIMYFASTKEMLEAIPQESQSFFGFEMQTRFVHTQLANNSFGILSNSEGLVSLEEYDPPPYYSSYSAYSPRENYNSKPASWENYGDYTSEYDDDYSKDWKPKEFVSKNNEEIIEEINKDLGDEQFKMIECDKCNNPVIIDLTDKTHTCDWCNTNLNIKE